MTDIPIRQSHALDVLEHEFTDNETRLCAVRAARWIDAVLWGHYTPQRLDFEAMTGLIRRQSRELDYTTDPLPRTYKRAA